MADVGGGRWQDKRHVRQSREAVSRGGVVIKISMVCFIWELFKLCALVNRV
nr:hypothetical protein Iba_chr12fCG11000 [Ipomoea batatas]